MNDAFHGGEAWSRPCDRDGDHRQWAGVRFVWAGFFRRIVASEYANEAHVQRLRFDDYAVDMPLDQITVRNDGRAFGLTRSMHGVCGSLRARASRSRGQARARRCRLRPCAAAGAPATHSTGSARRACWRAIGLMRLPRSSKMRPVRMAGAPEPDLPRRRCWRRAWPARPRTARGRGSAHARRDAPRPDRPPRRCRTGS